MEPQASEVPPVTEAATNAPAEAPVAAEASAPSADAAPPAATSGGGAAKRPTGRRRSRSFYGKENTDDPPAVVTLPPRAAPVRKNTGVNLDSIILQLTLKESISKEIERLTALGQYEDVFALIDVEAFDEEATQTLTKYSSPPEVKQFKDTPEGQLLLKRAIQFFKFFEAKEDRKECFNQLDFHIKCLVDDVLFRFLVDPPKNIHG